MSPSPSITTRIRTRLGRARLDRELANGADPAGSDELALRADQLGSPAERARIANGLVEALGDVYRGPPMTIGERPQREVLAAADEIRALALRLRDTQPLAVSGVAMAARLADDRSSPLRRYGAVDPDEAIASAHAALGAAQVVASEPEAARAA